MASLTKGLVIENRQVSRDMFEMELIVADMVELCNPGQFVNIKIGDGPAPLLRRPLSLFDVDKHRGSIAFLYKVLGHGTELLSRVRPKDYLDVMGPLGRGFTLTDIPGNALLVGGGVGIAPLIYLARELKESKFNVTVLHGVENIGQLVVLDKLRQMKIEFMPATMDGSAGFKGFVTDLLKEKIEPAEFDCIYTCGPELMMAAVAEYALKHRIWGQVSLEEHMACGVGACLGCARKLKDSDEHYVKVCKDGPVFNINEVELYKS